jgi:hypothetical protein
VTGLAGVGSILPPDPTPWISRQEETEALEAENVRLQGAVMEARKGRNGEGDTSTTSENTINHDLSVVDKFSNARDFFLYVNAFVADTINRSTRNIVLPLMKRPLVRVVNLELNIIGGDNEEKGELEKEHLIRNNDLRTEDDLKKAKVTEDDLRTAVEMNAEPVVYLDSWVKEAVDDEMRRKEIIAAHRNEHKKQERVTKLYSRDRENDLNRLEKLLPSSLGEMLWDLNV